MNAQGVKNEEHLEHLLDDPNYVAQEKLDGMRATVNITHKGLRIFSRSAGVNDPTRPLEKTKALPHLAQLVFRKQFGTVLDCEVLLPGQDSAVLSGCVHRKQHSRENGLVNLYIFDVLQLYTLSLMSKPLSYRIDTLEFLKSRIVSPNIVFLPWAFTAQEKRRLYDNVLARGGEGIILKRLDGYYIPAARPSNNWYKAKKSATFDCVVMGFTKGAGKYNNRIGAIEFGQYVNGKLIELGQASGMSDKERMQMSTSPGYYIGKVVTIKGMERLKSGAIRHPQYAGIRFDKKPKDCVWYEGEQ